MTAAITVVKGSPDPEEVAALVASLSLLVNQPAPTVPDAGAPAWQDRARTLHAPVAPSPSAWRWSARP